MHFMCYETLIFMQCQVKGTVLYVLMCVCVNFEGREWCWGLPVGAGIPLQCSVLHVQADGESHVLCFCVCTRETKQNERRLYGVNLRWDFAFVYARHKAMEEGSVYVFAWLMNNAWEEGVFIYNAWKMFACEREAREEPVSITQINVVQLWAVQIKCQWISLELASL